MNTSDSLTAVIASHNSNDRIFLIVICFIASLFILFLLRVLVRPNSKYPVILKREGFLWNNLPYWIWCLTGIPALLANIVLPYVYTLWLIIRWIAAIVMMFFVGMIYRDGKSENKFKDILIMLKLKSK